VSLPEVAEILDLLRSTDSRAIERMGEDAVVQAFQTAAAEVPAYRDLLHRHGVRPGEVKDLTSFRSLVPVLAKREVFGPYDMEALCREGSFGRIKSVLPSSGHSGLFAFSVNTARNIENTARMVDVALEYCLGIAERRGIVVNTYPMGVNIHTSLPTANAGVNVDIALALVKAFGPRFPQLVLIGQPLFTKRLIEAGLEQGVDWAALHTTVATGGEGASESWRTYISRRIGLGDPDRPEGRLVAASLGIGELDLNLFHEIPETIRTIRAAYRDRALREALFEEDLAVCPHLFVYYPMRTYVEEVPRRGSRWGELAVSMLSPDIVNPLIRYRTGDLVKLISHERLVKVLRDHGCDWAPGLRLPLVAVYGRSDRVAVRGGAVSAETVKEALFLDEGVAAAVTGFFKARAAEGRLAVDVQLRPGVEPSARLRTRLGDSLASVLPRKVSFRARLFSLRRFPYEVSYERKYAYLVQP
jgi:phenylacetate-CoA ligase